MDNFRKTSGNINAGSMADMAFLLLIFFLVTTTIADNKGLMLKLPPHQNADKSIARIHDRNLFKVLINSNDKIMVQGEEWDDINNLREKVKEFILNPKSDPSLSENPEEAIISLKTNRGTSYQAFILVLDELQGAYYDIYSSRAGITSSEFRNLNQNNPSEREIYVKARSGIPMNISIAEPER